MKNYLSSDSDETPSSLEWCSYTAKPEKPSFRYKLDLLPPPLPQPLYYAGGTKLLHQHLDGRISEPYGATLGYRCGSLLNDPLGRPIASISPGGLLQPPPTLNVPMFGFHH